MKAITLRNLPPELARRIEEESSERGTSLSKTIIRLLEEGLLCIRAQGGETLHHDLDRFAGSWSQEEADELDQAVRKQRTIEKELWG
ncbi:MAG: hypothetical protein HYV63_07420 [Candidatus Schekmanbacteria bacterium]|nr:hypothetical protein [Candidatus Schekmanbacteria bacterium]